MIERDELLLTRDSKNIWQKYCGFLDIFLGEFMKIQERLLLEEIRLVADSTLGRKIMKNSKPDSITEFRRLVPLTTYDDYISDLQQNGENMLAENPYIWVTTSGRSGTLKWVPLTQPPGRIQSITL